MDVFTPVMKKEGDVFTPIRVYKEDAPKTLIPSHPVTTIPSMEKVNERAMVHSKTLGIPFELAVSHEQDLSKIATEADPDWLKVATSEFKGGIGSTYVLFGRALELAGLEDTSQIYVDYGRDLQKKYVTGIRPEEFSFRDPLNPAWWSVTAASSIPTTLALIPAGLVAAYGGLKLGAVVGLGAFGKALLAGIGGGVVSRGIESAFEAAGTYETSLQQGESEEMAEERANYTFKHNLAELSAMDVGQWLLALLPVGNAGVPPSVKKKAVSAVLKVLGVSGVESIEEGWQTGIQQRAMGENIHWSSEMKDSMVLGAIFGLPMGSAQVAFAHLSHITENSMPNKMHQEFVEIREANLVAGESEVGATVKALDAIAETEEGKAVVEKVGQDLKKMAEGQFFVEKIDAEKVLESIEEVDIVTDEDVTQIAEGQDALNVIEERIGITEQEEILALQEEIKRERFITDEMYENAKAKLSEKLGGLKTGVDPTALSQMAIIGAYHLETGLIKFADWSNKMISEFGETIKPHLKQLWSDANKYLDGQRLDNRQTKKFIRKMTGQTSVVKLIREDVALNAAMKKAEQNARVAFREGRSEGITQAKEQIKDVILKARIKAELMGFKEGFRVGSRLTNQHLIQNLKENEAQMKEVTKTIVDYINTELPKELRGKFLGNVTDVLTRGKQKKIFDRVKNLKEKLRREDVLEDIASLQLLKGNIDVEYQKQIVSLIGDIHTKNITEKTLRKLQGLKDYMEKQGVPHGIHTHTIERLKRLEGRNASEMTTEDLELLANTAQFLTELGKLKTKMKFKNNERERNKAKKALVDSSHNIDPKVSDEETMTDKIKRGALWMYLESLQPPRVSDMIDGGSLKGENLKLMKRLIIAETLAQHERKALLTTAMKEMVENGVNEISKEQEVKIMINVRAREGAWDQVNTLMAHYDYDDIPVLGAKEEKIIEIIKKYMNQNTQRLAATYEEITNKIFPILPEYIIPLKYEGEFNIAPTKLIEHTRNRKVHPFSGMTIERKENVKSLPRVDLMAIFEEGIDQQLWYINMMPELEDIKYLVKSEEYYEKAGGMAYNYWKDHLDILSRRGWSATASHSPFSSFLGAARGNLSLAILGYKASSILMQPFALVDALSNSQAKLGRATTLEILKEFSKSWINGKDAKAMVDMSNALQLRQAGELTAVELMEKYGNKTDFISEFKKGGLKLLMWADIKTAAGVEVGIYNILKKNGVPNALEEADFITSMVSASSEIGYRPHILSRGQAARTALTFQTFFLNRWGLVAHDLVYSGLLKGDWKKKFGAMMGLAIITAGKIAEDETREFVFETITGKNIADTASMFKRIMFAIPSNIPFFGNLFEIGFRRTLMDIPITRLFEDFFYKGFIKAFTAEEFEGRAKAAMKMIEAGMTLYGVPGTAQGFDLLEALLFSPEEKKSKPLTAPKIRR